MAENEKYSRISLEKSITWRKIIFVPSVLDNYTYKITQIENIINIKIHKYVNIV